MGTLAGHAAVGPGRHEKYLHGSPVADGKESRMIAGSITWWSALLQEQSIPCSSTTREFRRRSNPGSSPNGTWGMVQSVSTVPRQDCPGLHTGQNHQRVQHRLQLSVSLM